MAEEKKEKQKEKKERPKAEEKRPEAKPEVHAPKPAHAEAPKHEAKPVHAEAPKAEAKPEKKKAKKKGAKVSIARGKRKTCVARAVVREGHGRIRVNRLLTSAMQNRLLKELIEEPLRLAGPEGNKVDVDVNVYGGGESGQAQASRTAVARALAEYFGEGLKKSYEEMDKYLLDEDPRRVEPKKYKGRKARARFQKSYR